MPKAKKVGPFGDGPPSVVFRCPGCKNNHAVPYTLQRPPPSTPVLWFWDENTEQPTIEPSLRIMTADGKGADCHVVITKGVLNYCSDCKHPLAGKSVPMEEVGA